jgi:hypothetical protein
VGARFDIRAVRVGPLREGVLLLECQFPGLVRLDLLVDHRVPLTLLRDDSFPVLEAQDKELRKPVSELPQGVLGVRKQHGGDEVVFIERIELG